VLLMNDDEIEIARLKSEIETMAADALVTEQQADEEIQRLKGDLEGASLSASYYQSGIESWHTREMDVIAILQTALTGIALKGCEVDAMMGGGPCRENGMTYRCSPCAAQEALEKIK
jgi:hypothetical protein